MKHPPLLSLSESWGNHHSAGIADGAVRRSIGIRCWIPVGQLDPHLTGIGSCSVRYHDPPAG